MPMKDTKALCHAPIARRALIWRRPASVPAQRIPMAFRPGLLDPGSLTARLKARCPDSFRVELVRQDDRPATREVRARLGLPRGARVIEREVYLYGQGCRLVFAHSVLPRASLTGHWRRLARLGTRPLGEALFADHRIRRGGLELGRLSPGMVWYERAVCGLGRRPEAIWGRRSAFWLPRGGVLVCEFFLPDFAAVEAGGRDKGHPLAW